ncbi:ENTH domain-containing protein [Chloropicon primus]|nr:ENTH domain-containing protein [Chloropicon primus]
MRSVKKVYKGLKKSALDEDPWASRTKEATSQDAWGPTGTQLNELANATAYGPEVFNEIFNVLYRRLDERESKWRKCHKALIILEFFLLKGDKHCINPVRIGRFGPKLRELVHFSHQDPATGEDAGARISKRAKAILEMTEDVEDLMERRERASKTRSCVGISSDDNIAPPSNGREEVYTAGKNSFERNVAEGKKFKEAEVSDDWGSRNMIDSPGRDGFVPKSLIESPDVHQVKISKDAFGRVRSIEGMKVPAETAESPLGPRFDDDPFGLSGQVGGGEGQSVEAAGTSHPNPSHRELRKVARKHSSRRLGAPPTDGSGSNRGAASGATPEARASVPEPLLDASAGNANASGAATPPPSSSFFDFFDSVVGGAPTSATPEAGVSRRETNPFAAFDEGPPGALAGTGGTPPAHVAVQDVEETVEFWRDQEAQAEAAAPPGRGGADPGKQEFSDLVDWTNKIGFDFQNLDLDTSHSPYKELSSSSKPSEKRMQGPSMKTLSAEKNKRKSNGGGAGAVTGGPSPSSWEPFQSS